MNYPKSIDNVTDMCRICLSRSKNMVSMDKKFKNESILQKLETSFSMKISKNPQLPSHICKKCIDSIKFPDDLKQIYQKSQDIFRRYTHLSATINNDSLVLSGLQVKLDLKLPEESVAAPEQIDKTFFEEPHLSNEKKTIASVNIVEGVPLYKQKFRCKYCHKCFSSREHVKKHFKSCNSKSAKCEYCSKEFSSRILKISHVRNAHKPKEKRVYKCDICNEQFRTPNSKTYHNLTRHNDNPPEYSCEVCGKKFVIKNSLRLHMFKHNKDQAKVVCPICGKSFHYTGGLYYHMKVHKNERNYKCTFCPRVFLNMTALKRHTRTHTGERPYKCHMCPKDFCSTGELKTHIMRHTGHKPHICKFCKKPYVSRYNLHIHMSSHSGLLPCKYCQKKYLNEEVLELHIKFKHKDKYKKPRTPEELVDEEDEVEEPEYVMHGENEEDEIIFNGFEEEQIDQFHLVLTGDGMVDEDEIEEIEYIENVDNGEEIMFEGFKDDSYLVYE